MTKQSVQGLAQILSSHFISKRWIYFPIYDIIITSYMAHETTSTIRARRLRERRSRGVLMVAPVEIGEGGVALLVGNGLLKENETRNRNAVGAACLEALEQWAKGLGALSKGQG